MSTLPKSTYKFNVIPFKISVIFSSDLEKCQNSYENATQPRTPKAILNQNKIGGIAIPDLKMFYRAM